MCLWSINVLIKGNKLLDRYQFIIIPVLNPDGYVYTWETDRNWRKTRFKFNKTHESESCFRIDANRKYNLIVKTIC